jgi:hypothetical protein
MYKKVRHPLIGYVFPNKVSLITRTLVSPTARDWTPRLSTNENHSAILQHSTHGREQFPEPLHLCR